MSSRSPAARALGVLVTLAVISVALLAVRQRIPFTFRRVGSQVPLTTVEAGRWGELEAGVIVEAEGAAATGHGGVAPRSDGDAPFFGFCPSDAPEIERPSLAAVVNERIAELTDRARARQGSEPLRRGLTLLYAREGDAEAALRSLAAAPDRHAQGFDHLSAAALLLGVRALQAGELDRATRWARRAATAALSDPAPLVLEALAARRDHDEHRSRELLWQAHERAPHQPAVALAVGTALVDEPDLDRPLAALGAYLEAYPDDASIAGLRARLEIRDELWSEFHRARRDGVTLLWSPDVSDELARAAHDIVLGALDEAADLLGTERREELTVVVYAARADVLASTCVQSWARAVFDGTLHLDGEGLEDPRRLTSHIEHESLHAQLHASAPSAPVWLQEGLAQHLADQHSSQVERSWRFMVEHDTWVPLGSMAGSFQVISDSGDAQLAYHQSLAMVELLIDRGGEASIRRAVAYLSDGGDPDGLLDHLGGGQPITGRDLITFLARQLE